jgi:hypothetical protein
VDGFEKKPTIEWEKTFTVKGLKLKVKMFIKHRQYNRQYYCGYACFSEPLLPETDDYTDGVISFVPVHGGITFNQYLDDAFVYGFDCNHVGDEHKEYTEDINWLKEETERMVVGIILLSQFQFSLEQVSAEEESSVLDDYYKQLKDAYKENNLKEDTKEEDKSPNTFKDILSYISSLSIEVNPVELEE